MRLKKFTLVLLIVFAFQKIFSQATEKKYNQQLFEVGYRSFITTDSGRLYKTGVSASDRFYFRPIEIDFWYPASYSKAGSPMLYGDFLDLLEKRSNRFQNDTVYKKLTTDLAHYLGINLKIQDTTLLQMKTSSYLNADAIKGTFPLILYMSSYNGISYENLGLFEWLAANGYMVVCVTSVGRYPGNMTTKIDDVMEQVEDGLFILNYLKKKTSIDSTKIGAVGYSWGGLASLILSMKAPDIKALLSLDGSEMHYYGESVEEDLDFDEIRRASFFRASDVHAPYAYLESGHKQLDRQVDSIYNMLPMIGSPKHYVHFPKASHEDFSFISSFTPLGRVKYNDSSFIYNQVKEFSLNYFNTLLHYKSNHLSAQLNFIYRNLGDSIYPKIIIDTSKRFAISGKVLDVKNNEPLPYVNIGIKNKNIGTVTQRDGSFQMRIPPDLARDSLTISMAGYNSQTISVSRIIRESKSINILLKERYTELNEVVITEKTLPVKILGNTTTSNFVSVGLPLKFLGSEVGVKINLGKKSVMLKKFSFNVSGNRLDTAVFRMNIYDVRNGVPFENVLQKNILIPVGKRTGLYMIDLSEYKIEMKGEILLSLEWIEGSSSSSGNGAIFLSAGFLNSSTWHRITSQGEWKKAPGLGVGLNIEVQKLSAP